MQYSDTIRSRMMRQQLKQSNKATVGGGSPLRNQQMSDSITNRSPGSKKGPQGEGQRQAQPQINVHTYQNDKKFYQGRSVKVEALPSLSNERKLAANIKEEPPYVLANSDSFGAPEAAADSARQQFRFQPDAGERAPETLPSAQKGQPPREDQETKTSATKEPI